ncbi:MAG: Replication protein phage-associated [Acidimicrobiaceae bacterium]|nr:Replication protein phage-associated [Acidimicrobiaceae bacterium]
MGLSDTFTLDATGQPWFDVDDHGEARRTRWKRRTRARQIAYIDDDTSTHQESSSPLKRLKTCGLAKNPDVVLRVHNGRGFATGLMACGNIWTCPTCSARIRARRTVEVEKALDEHCKSGGRIGMMTLTLQHDDTMPLKETIERLNRAWNDLTGRRRYRKLHMALTGTITTLEITTGTGHAGWHPHLHIILLAGPDSTEATIREATRGLHSAWSGLVNKVTTKYTLERGLNLVWFGKDSAAAAKYVNKIAKEVTLTDTKNGNDPFALLDDSDHKHTAMFLEYANATYSRQAQRWSSGLRRTLSMQPELTDEELAEENEAVGNESLIITRELWNKTTETERLAWIELAEALDLFDST